jgi:hypothetical protein
VVPSLSNQGHHPFLESLFVAAIVQESVGEPEYADRNAHRDNNSPHLWAPFCGARENVYSRPQEMDVLAHG